MPPAYCIDIGYMIWNITIFLRIYGFGKADEFQIFKSFKHAHETVIISLRVHPKIIQCFQQVHLVAWYLTDKLLAITH